MENNSGRRVALACQGGGSHTAFTAGALKKLLKDKEEYNYEVVALTAVFTKVEPPKRVEFARV